MRFEWFALLAFKRVALPADQAWVSLDEVGALPAWRGRHSHHNATNVGRYLQSDILAKARVVVAGNPWSGPYRLELNPLAITFDITRAEVRHRLHLRWERQTRQAIWQFTRLYARAQWLFYRGRLHCVPTSKTKLAETAFGLLRGLMDEPKYGPALRLLSCLAASEVLFRIGRVKAARETLEDKKHLLRSVVDQSIKAQFHLKMAWAIQRASSGAACNRAVDAALARAGALAENSGDRASLGLLAHRTALYITKRGRHSEAVDHLTRALEAHLVTGNFHLVQAICGDLGSIVHRFGPKHYEEARAWLLLSILVARWMGIGREDAHSEMILGKIYLEQGKAFQSQWLLQRAEHIAKAAGNQINLADIKMVSGLWYRRFGSRREQLEAVTEALNIYRNLYEFDVAQKERYMSRKFPEVWDEVLERVSPK